MIRTHRGTALRIVRAAREWWRRLGDVPAKPVLDQGVGDVTRQFDPMIAAREVANRERMKGLQGFDMSGKATGRRRLLGRIV